MYSNIKLNGKRLFRCSKCNKLAVELVQYKGCAPMGVCTLCKECIHLTVEDIDKMLITKRVCDVPGCNSDITNDPIRSLSIGIKDSSGITVSTILSDVEICSKCEALIAGYLHDIGKIIRSARMSRARGNITSMNTSIDVEVVAGDDSNKCTDDTITADDDIPDMFSSMDDTVQVDEEIPQ